MVDFENWALILVDMQNDFLAKGGYYDRKEKYEAQVRQGKLSSEEMIIRLTQPSSVPRDGFEVRIASLTTIVDIICKVVTRAKKERMKITYLRAVYDHKFDFRPRFLANPDRKHYPCKSRTWGAAFIDPINKLIPEKTAVSGETVIEKHTFDGFFKTDLCKFLRTRRVHTVLVAGVETHICVLATAQSASLHQFETIILEDCVATAREDLAECALEVFRDGFGNTKLSAEIFQNL